MTQLEADLRAAMQRDAEMQRARLALDERLSRDACERERRAIAAKRRRQRRRTLHAAQAMACSRSKKSITLPAVSIGGAA